MSVETIKIDGRVYVSHSCWTFGDYGGAGSLGLANIRYIIEQCETHCVMEIPMSTLRHISEGCPFGLGDDELKEIRTERPWAIDAYGDYGSRQIWVRKPVACRLSSHGFRGRTWIEQMDSYPVLDDDLINEIEVEWEDEAWNDWLRSDLIRTLPDDGSREEAEMMHPDVLFDAYQEAKEETNVQVVSENNGVHVDVDRIANAFAEIVAEKIADIYIP